jgi:DNA-binding IclR family transcriptional regulator
MSDDSGRTVGSVARAVALLDALAEGPAGVNALARRIGVNPSSASRLLATLERGGLVEREPGGPYRLGLHLVALADRVLSRLDVRDLARPQLRALVEQTGETATLSVPGGDEAVTVDFVAGQSSVVSMARLGRPSIGHATAAGKVLLAFTGAEPGALAVYTERTITDPARLAAELALVREQGWAEAEGEREPDLNALAAPVVERAGALVAILGLQGPGGRLTANRRREVLPALLRAAGEVSRALGGPPSWPA